MFGCGGIHGRKLRKFPKLSSITARNVSVWREAYWLFLGLKTSAGTGRLWRGLGSVGVYLARRLGSAQVQDAGEPAQGVSEDRCGVKSYCEHGDHSRIE